MKTLFFVFFIVSALTFSVQPGQAANYHFSTDLGDDSRSFTEAQDPNTPWKSIQKLNEIFNTLKPGDQVLFRRGEKFFGSITINQSGSAGNPIVIGAYGEGDRPVISGFMDIEKWTLFDENVYQTDLDVSSLNLLILNGNVEGMGRYPNNGYSIYNQHTKNESIIDEKGIRKNWIGAEVVIRKHRWILDRHIITYQHGNTLRYNSLSNYGNNSIYEPLNGNGYFIQGHIETLDKPGEWYYDSKSKKLYIYFDFSSGESDVKVSILDRNFTVNTQNNIIFNNLHFEGANNNGGYLVGSQNILIKSCNFSKQGGNGLYGINVSNIKIESGEISNVLNNGIWIENQGHNISVEDIKLSNIGIIAGAGRSGDAAQEGISIQGDNTNVSKCSVINIGYNAISFSGDNAVIKENYIDRFCTLKDDGAGIYTYKSDNAKIKSNIVLNAVGAYEGAEWAYWEPYGKAVGIYLDNGTENHNATVLDNTIAHGEWAGIFVNNNSGNSIENNTIFNHDIQLLIVEFDHGNVINTKINNNKFVNKEVGQKAIRTILYNENEISNFGEFNSNLYVANEENLNIFQTTEDGYSHTYSNKSLTEWQQYSDNDIQSRLSNVLIKDSVDIFFEYNNLSTPKYIPLESTYLGLEGKTYQNEILLEPYSSIVLIESSDSTIVKDVVSTIIIVNPKDNTQLIAGNDVDISVEVVTGRAEDIERVNYYFGESLISTESENPFLCTWKDLPYGNNYLHVEAFDKYNRVITSDSTYVEVKEKNVPAIITLDIPSESLNLIEGEDFQLNGSAIDLDGEIVLIEIFANNELLGSTSQNPFDFTWMPASEGSYVITVKVTDNEGLESISDPFQLTVKQDISVAPGDNTLSEGNSLFVNWGSNAEVNLLSEAFKGEDAVIDYIKGKTSTFSDSSSIVEPLFQTERFGTEFSIAVPVPNGTYMVKTYHNELWFGKGGSQAKAGQRVYDIVLQQKTVREKFDLFLENGNQPTVLTFEHVQVTNGILELRMKAYANNASISGMAIFEGAEHSLPDTNGPSGKVVLRLKSGNLSDVVFNGEIFETDAKYQGYYGNSNTYSNSMASDQPLFQSERNGAELNYAIPLPNGMYTVKTYHHELYFGFSGPAASAGRRVFDIALENQTVKKEFDLYVENQNRPTVLTFEQISVTDGVLNIDMAASINRATISAISIYKNEENVISTSGGEYTRLLNAGGQTDELFIGEVFTSEANSDMVFHNPESWTYSNSSATDERLFQTERNSGQLSYRIPVPNDTYTVYTMHNELYFGYAGPSATVGRRVFDIHMEGKLVKKGFDIFVENGNKPTVLEFKDILVSDGFLDLEMLAIQNRASLSGIAILGSPKGTAIHGATLKEYAEKEGINIETVEKVQKEEIGIYPNPAHKSVTVEISCAVSEGRVLIHTMSGQLVRHFDFSWLSDNSNHYTIPLDHISQGTYLITVVDKLEIIKRQRLIVTN